MLRTQIDAALHDNYLTTTELVSIYLNFNENELIFCLKRMVRRT